MFFRFVDWYFRLLIKVLIFLMFVLMLAVGLTVAGRYIPFVPRWLWTLEITNFSLIWMVFIGAIVGLRDKRHFYIDIFPDTIPTWFHVFLQLIYYVVTLTITLVFIIFGYRFLVKWGMIQTSDLTGVNLGFLYASVPVAGISWLLFLMEGIYRDFFQHRADSGHLVDVYQAHKEEAQEQEGGES